MNCNHDIKRRWASITNQATDEGTIVKWLFVGCCDCGEHIYNGPFHVGNVHVLNDALEVRHVVS